MQDIPHLLDTEIPNLASQFGCSRECFTSFIGSSRNISVILQQPALYCILISHFTCRPLSKHLPSPWVHFSQPRLEAAGACVYWPFVFFCECLAKLSHRSEVSQQHGSPARLIAHCEGFSDPCQALVSGSQSTSQSSARGLTVFAWS